MKAIKEVEAFITEFFKKEYDLANDCNNLIGTRNENEKRVYSFFDKYGISAMYSFFSELLAWPYDESKEQRGNYIKDMLRVRKLFVIEEYKNPELGQSVIGQGIKSEQLFACYVSHKHKIANNRYFNRIMVGESNDNKCKIIAVQLESLGSKYPLIWQEFHMEGEEPDIKNLGEFMNKKQYQAPELERHLKHYNS